MAGLVTRVAQASVGAVKDARSVLAAGGLVAFPTETVYGLGADATNDKAVAKLYAVKERPSFNPLIAHVADLAAATRLAVFDDAALHLARAFWPGPLTLVLAQGRPLPGRPPGDGGPRHHRGAGAEPSGRPRNPRRVRQARGGAVGEPVRQGLAHHGAARAPRPSRPHRPPHQ